jgi:hypothetical protein
MSQEIVRVIPEDVRAWRTRGYVLCAQPDMPATWAVGPRTAAELLEAARCYAKTVPSPISHLPLYHTPCISVSRHRAEPPS